METVTLKLPVDLMREAWLIAKDRDITLGQLTRDLLSKEISRHKNARPPIRADERLVAPLRARLAADFAHATGWADLDRRLSDKGYVLRAAGGGLALHRRSSGDRLCKASELGFGYSRLVERFRAAFPGHSHTWIAERVLNQADTDVDLIEPF